MKLASWEKNYVAIPTSRYMYVETIERYMSEIMIGKVIKI